MNFMNPEVPLPGALQFENIPCIFDVVNDNGVYIPENEKEGGILNESPSGLFGQSVLAKPVDKDPHRYNEEKMTELMYIYTLLGGVNLGGCRFSRESQAKEKRKNDRQKWINGPGSIAHVSPRGCGVKAGVLLFRPDKRFIKLSAYVINMVSKSRISHKLSRPIIDRSQRIMEDLFGLRHSTGW
jgi:hypothetical protein